jgi:hypothetical protein
LFTAVLILSLHGSIGNSNTQTPRVYDKQEEDSKATGVINLRWLAVFRTQFVDFAPDVAGAVLAPHEPPHGGRQPRVRHGAEEADVPKNDSEPTKCRLDPSHVLLALALVFASFAGDCCTS